MNTGFHVKQREIRFCRIHPEPNQALSAAERLSDLEGVESATALTGHLLETRYDLNRVTLQDQEELLTAQGYHLDNSLLAKLKRALYYYAEETERANLGIPDKNSKTTVFVQHYDRRQHGCRDERPEHWRGYL